MRCSRFGRFIAGRSKQVHSECGARLLQMRWPQRDTSEPKRSCGCGVLPESAFRILADYVKAVKWYLIATRIKTNLSHVILERYAL